MNIFAADNNIVKIVVNLIAYRGNARYSLFVPALPNNVIVENTRHKYCAAGFALLNLPKGKSLGRSKPETNSSNEQAH
jgi:hypothetical protein